jgi:hypothetical protein
MISRHQCQLEMPACLRALCDFFPLQQISDELPLICGRSFATAEWVQKDETVPDEHWAENLCKVLEREPELETVLPRSVASAVVEDDCGKRTGTRGPPQEPIQLKTTIQNLDSLLLWPFNDLRDSRAGNRQRDCEHEQSSHPGPLGTADRF